MSPSHSGRGRDGGAATVAATAVAGSYLAVRTGLARGMDAAAGRVLAARGPRPLDRSIAIASDLGSSFAVAGLSAVLAVSGRRRAAVRVGASGALAFGLAQAVKPALPRARPYERGTAARLVSPPAGGSWPSGHAAVAAGMARALGQVGGGPRVAGLAASAAAGVGASRVTVGVHHLSDVVAGLGVGVVAAEVVGFALDGRRPRRPTTR